ncbi:MAG: methytransferase partner Trm112 [Dehalococcoidia bacterium]|nr:methytransferase partner Trm112 [Dehalococcoidia bacterium]
MRRDLLDILACPDDKAALALSAEEEADGEVASGALTCAACGAVYPIEDGIPNLLPQSMRG